MLFICCIQTKILKSHPLSWLYNLYSEQKNSILRPSDSRRKELVGDKKKKNTKKPPKNLLIGRKTDPSFQKCPNPAYVFCAYLRLSVTLSEPLYLHYYRCHSKGF